jgi:2-keto-3-deoxy-6-phosphogluconate aldolase
VSQQTAFNFILAGASALGIGADLMPPEDLQSRREGRIRELARRFLRMVKAAREQLEGGL